MMKRKQQHYVYYTKLSTSIHNNQSTDGDGMGDGHARLRDAD